MFITSSSFFIFLASNIKNNAYTRVVLNPKYKNKYLTLNIILDEYFPTGNSPNIHNWKKPVNFLSKIKALNYV